MPAFAKEDLMSALHASVKELQQGIDRHTCLVASIFRDEVDERGLQSALQCCSYRSNELCMKEAIKEAIEVLEESRKAFKSKRLEKLRKRLTQVLIDTQS